MEEKKIKILLLNGEKQNWNMCSRKFLFNLNVQGFRDILQEDQEIKSEERDQQEELNMILYSHLLLSMEYTVWFSIVDMERSNDHPQVFSGHHSESWSEILNLLHKLPDVKSSWIMSHL